MDTDFTHTILGRTGLKVHRLGLSATYRPSKKTLYMALDKEDMQFMRKFEEVKDTLWRLNFI